MGVQPHFIGIAGPSCAGKSALARRLARRRAGKSTLVVPLDCYYRDLASLRPALRDERNFDHPGALDRRLIFRQLRTLARGGTIELPVYDFATHCRAARGRRVRPAEIIIVEGLFALYWRELRERLELKIFIDAADEVCLERRVERDIRSRGRRADEVREQYARTVRSMYERYVLPTRDAADVVVRGEGGLSETVSRLLPHVTGIVSR